ncbi:MAG: hypothetical protein ABEI53_00230 [Candidatus Magasanikbacteria bacterium]
MPLSSSQEITQTENQLPPKPDFSDGEPSQKKIANYVNALIEGWNQSARSEKTELQVEASSQIKELRKVLNKIDEPWRIRDLIRRKPLSLLYKNHHKGHETPLGALKGALLNSLQKKIENTQDLERLLSLELEGFESCNTLETYNRKLYKLVSEKIDKGDSETLRRCFLWLKDHRKEKPCGWEAVRKAFNHKRNQLLGIQI